MIKAIFATGLNGEIGQNGDMPWGRSLSRDLEYFKKATLYQNVVIGKNTFDTLPFKGKGFPERDTIVLTRGGWKSPILSDGESVYFFSEKELRTEDWDEYTLWIAGGGQTYKILSDLIEEYHITTVNKSYPEADTFFKPDLSNFEKVDEPVDVSSDDLEASVQVWKRVER